ncbi:single-stranded DNA-binding protein [Orenia marismortui]|uniref:Single-stranded DNA-binding protein n=1 Tax=Orenia marismortui TaxID=46469 RepID=A0A4R8H827_9FIRM|nr:single-stranded DNA-binding protein [Orenia marismortui]TDX51795.1 single-strand DNA-binding protein [Orenia marismortui]
MLNKVILIGRLGADPELRYTPNGTAVCNFSLAVERDYTNQQGERDVDWVDIVVWRKQAETCANHLEKGRLVAVEGRLQVRYYETNEGQRRKVTEIVANSVRFLDWSSNNNRNNNNSNSNSNNNTNSNNNMQSMEEDIEVPF